MGRASQEARPGTSQEDGRIVYAWPTMTDRAPTVRRAARVLLLDGANRVLLVEFSYRGRRWWCAPGGGLEDGESHEDAARREVAEDLARRLLGRGGGGRAASRGAALGGDGLPARLPVASAAPGGPAHGPRRRPPSQHGVYERPVPAGALLALLLVPPRRHRVPPVRVRPASTFLVCRSASSSHATFPILFTHSPMVQSYPSCFFPYPTECAHRRRGFSEGFLTAFAEVPQGSRGLAGPAPD